MKQNVQFPFQNRSAAESTKPAADDEDRTLRALTVLECLARAQHPQTLAQLAQRQRMPKTTLMRLLRAMENAGFVVQMPAERGFMPGPRAAAIAMQTLKGPPMLRECRAILGRLVASLGETCNLTTMDGDHVLYVERVETDEPLRLQLSPGIRVPLHCTASGKLFLAAMSRAERQQTLRRLEIRGYTPRTLTDIGALDTELDRLGAQGIGVDNEEFVRGMTAVAVPVRAGGGTADSAAPDGPVIAAIACHAPTARVSLEALVRAVPTLREAARGMAKVLCDER